MPLENLDANPKSDFTHTEKTMYRIATYTDQPLALELILDLFKASFCKDLNLDYWRWRFLNNPADPKPRIVYAIDGDSLAAYYAVSPVRCYIAGKTSRIALSNMTMTHPNHQGKGLFKELATRLYAELSQDNYQCVFGFANANSHYGFRKNLGWKDLSLLTLITHTHPERLKGFSVPGIESECAPITNDDIEMMASMVSARNCVVPSRDQDILQWRFAQNPVNQYRVAWAKRGTQPLCIVVYKMFQGGADIMECFYHHDHFGSESLFHSTLSSIILDGAETLSIWSNLHSEEHLSLEKMGFLETEFITYFGMIPLSPTAPPELHHYANWHYRFLDSDVF